MMERMLSVNEDKSWCVYIVECDDDSLYTGVTNNIEKRFNAHASGKGAKYFRLRKPMRIVYTEQNLSKSSAHSREYAIKQLKKVDKQQLIKEVFSQCLNEQ